MVTDLLQQTIESAVIALGLEFVGLELASNDKQPVLRIFIDSEAGIKIADCEAVSRQVSSVLAVKLSAYKDYTLEVSSPGLDRRLFTLAHFQRFLGQKVRIKCRNLVGGRRTFVGCLQTATAETVIVVDEGQPYAIPFKCIAKANLIYQPVKIK